MKSSRNALWIFLTLIVVSACGPVPLQRLGGYQCIPCTDLADQADNSPTAVTLAGTDWLYQLQEADPTEIEATDFDIAVIDYSKDGEEAGRYSAGEIAILKSGSTFTRQVVAYLSIGEAEDYRYYFEPSWVSFIEKQPDSSAPCWLARTNPDWEGNYKVQYWSEDWQQIVLAYLDRIIDDGFDGVYLDIIDAFEYWSDRNNGEGYYISEREAAVRMINFVKRLAYHARFIRGKTDFLVIPQNGERLLSYDSGIDYLGADDYLNTISGIGVEDLYYDETTSVSPSITAAREVLINEVQDAGKKVLVVDYVDQGSRPVGSTVTDFLDKAATDGYLPYAARTDRELDEINSFPGQP